MRTSIVRSPSTPRPRRTPPTAPYAASLGLRRSLLAVGVSSKGAEGRFLSSHRTAEAKQPSSAPLGVIQELYPNNEHKDKEENSMKAIVRYAYGPPDVLELRDIDKPEIGDEEVLVRVHAAGVGRDVWHVMTGLPYPIRLAGYGLRAPKYPVIGSDVAGAVEAVGKNVRRFHPGDEVFGIGKGSYAEYVCAREDKLAHKPENLTFEQAAVVAISGLPALQGLRDHGRVEPEQKVLVIGASGGVGTYAVQIAKAFGAQVTGVCSTTKVDMIRSIGADHVIDYTRDDFAEGDQRYDLILDIGGNSSLSRLRRALTPEGTLVITGGETDGRWLGG